MQSEEEGQNRDLLMHYVVAFTLHVNHWQNNAVSAVRDKKKKKKKKEGTEKSIKMHICKHGSAGVLMLCMYSF